MMQGLEWAAIATIAAPQERDVARQEQAAPPRVPPAVSVDAEPDDIIVEGYRERGDIATDTAPPATVSGRVSRTKYEFSERIAKCAARSRLSSLARLRAVVDGEVNSAAFVTAQDRLIRINITCSESPSLLSFTAPPQNALELGSVRSIGRTISPG